MLSARHSTLSAVACAAALLLLLVGHLAYAQSATGDIQGTVVDQSGAVLPGVTVTVTNTATGVQREAGHRCRGTFRRARPAGRPV